MSDEVTHSVTWENGIPTFWCSGDSSAPCHQYPDCDEHELWPCGCEFKPHEVCWQIPWLDAAPIDSYFDDDSLIMADNPPQVDGEIETEWEGECLLWTYKESVDPYE